MKTQVVSKPYYDEQGYDTFVRDNDNKVYAIFDGMGVSEGSRFASTYCKEQTEARAADFANGHAPNYAKAMDEYSDTIGASSPQGGTTGVIVHVNNSGILEWSLIGDSRLYVFRDGMVIQIGQDEGMGNILTNYIGLHTQGCQQWGQVPDWDKFMICSDGITGDWPDQFLDAADMTAAFELDKPRDICNKFIEISKKPDDKTIIVGVK